MTLLPLPAQDLVVRIIFRNFAVKDNKMMKEVWKDIVGYEGRYQVSNLGRVRSRAENKRIWKIRRLHVEPKRGYFCVALADGKGGHKGYYVQRLVAMAFVEGYKPGLYVNHKDENRQNNRWDNLEWVTMTENNNYGHRNERVGAAFSKPVIQVDADGVIIARYPSAAAAERATGLHSDGINRCCCGHQTTYGGYRWIRDDKDWHKDPIKKLTRLTVEVLPDEEWRPIDGYNGRYMVSNKARVKSLNYRGAGEALLAQRQNVHGYLEVSLSCNQKTTSQRVHRLVAKAFVDGYKQGLVVNHKDEDRLNNLPENLEWCTTQYNCNYGNHAEHASISLSKRPVVQMTLNGDVVAVHRNIIKAAEELRKQGIASAQFAMISACCLGTRGITTAYGYRWRRKEKGERINITAADYRNEYTTKNRLGHAIVQLTMDGRVVGTYKSMLAAVKANGFPSHSSIGYCLKGKAKQAYGYQWKHITDLPEGFLDAAERVKLENATVAYKPKSRQPRAIVQLTLSGEFVAEYPSLKAAANAIGLTSHGSICTHIRNKTQQSHGFRWMDKRQYEKEQSNK